MFFSGLRHLFVMVWRINNRPTSWQVSGNSCSSSQEESPAVYTRRKCWSVVSGKGLDIFHRLLLFCSSVQVRGIAGTISAADMETEVTSLFATELLSASEHCAGVVDCLWIIVSILTAHSSSTLLCLKCPGVLFYYLIFTVPFNTFRLKSLFQHF